MLKKSDYSFLGRFESFGANCEFGFVQERCNIDVAGIFRWAEIGSIGALTAILGGKFQNIYNFENLCPFNAGMVIDVSLDVAWHSILRSELIEPNEPPVPKNFRFLESDSARRKLWMNEIGKVNYLIERTVKGLQAGNKIYVYKPLRAKVLTEVEVDELYAAIRAYNFNYLLIVTAAREGEECGHAQLVRPGLIHGLVDRFAPGRNARDISLDSWLSVCEKTAALAGTYEVSNETFS